MAQLVTNKEEVLNKGFEIHNWYNSMEDASFIAEYLENEHKEVVIVRSKIDYGDDNELFTYAVYFKMREVDDV